MKFSVVVKSVRKELGLSQEQLARKLNINFSTINRREKGKTHPSQMAQELFYVFFDRKNINTNSYTEGEVCE